MNTEHTDHKDKILARILNTSIMSSEKEKNTYNIFSENLVFLSCFHENACKTLVDDSISFMAIPILIPLYEKHQERETGLVVVQRASEHTRHVMTVRHENEENQKEEMRGEARRDLA